MRRAAQGCKGKHKKQEGISGGKVLGEVGTLAKVS